MLFELRFWGYKNEAFCASKDGAAVVTATEADLPDTSNFSASQRVANPTEQFHNFWQPRLYDTRRTSDTMPDPVSVGIAVGVATGAAAIAQSRLQAARDAKAAELDASTISGILKEMSLTTSRVRQGAYGRLASGSTPRRPSLTRRPSAKRVPIFSYGEVAGLSVRLPADGKTCGPKGLLVTDALRGQWAHQCGVQAGARLVSIDGTRLEGLDAAEIRLAASRASRPLWLDVESGGQAPTGDALSGAHLLL